MKRFHIYATDHAHSRNVCGAVAKGTGLPMVPVAPLQDGGVCMYGFLRGLLPTLSAARAEGRPWVYIDRGYFRASRGDDYTGYFRLTRNGLQHDGRGDADAAADARWSALMLKLAPWRRQGKHVLVCPPGDTWLGAMGAPYATTQKEWIGKTLDQLHANTERPIRIRYKPKNVAQPEVPLIEDLQDCWALVTHASNTAVEAACAGVPVYVLGPGPGQLVGQRDLTKIESPVYPDRESWVRVLAANQWTLDELRRGAANHLFD